MSNPWISSGGGNLQCPLVRTDRRLITLINDTGLTNRMDAKPVLITGCSSGIGRCVARGLAARGYRVFATARRQEDVEHLRAEGFTSLQLDLEDSGSIAAAVDAVLAHTDGRLYALFNNGAYGQPGAVEDLSREVLRLQFETNLFGWHELTNRVLPVMRRQGYGRIIHNSSVLGFVALPFRGAYTASKYALEGLTDTLRLELHGIRHPRIADRTRADRKPFPAQCLCRLQAPYRPAGKCPSRKVSENGGAPAQDRAGGSVHPAAGSGVEKGRTRHSKAAVPGHATTSRFPPIYSGY